MVAIQRVGVVGCGLMGSGIAEVCAKAGFETLVVESDDTQLARGRGRIESSMNYAVKKEKLSPAERDAAHARIKYSVRMEDLAHSDLVIEAIIEQLAAKEALFKRLDSVVQKSALFASNTSNLSITELGVASGRPAQFGGLHFFNPVPVMQLVEVVRSTLTSPATHEQLLDFARRLGKQPIQARDTCGFIVNVLLLPFLYDAIRLVEHGVASIPDIDSAMKLGCGHPMGPLELADFVGIDTTHHISVTMFDEYKSERYAPPPLLKKMFLAGLHGRKTGKGFYDYADPKNPKPMRLV
ncbi:MAG: 3-hydroxyacyl-CoA dehydrogenase family protein [Planctomycetota bacterium]